MSEEILRELRGKTKAALLLGFFPMEISQTIVSYLDNYEREILIKEITNMPKYDPSIIEAVVKEYLLFLKGQNVGIVNSGAEYAIRLVEGSMPKEELEEMVGRLWTSNGKPFDSLKRIRDVAPLLTFLQYEDPQTIAVIVSHMKPSQAGELLESLPEAKRVEVGLCVAKMEQTNSEVLNKVERFLNKKIEQFVSEDQNTTDGIKTLVNILNNVNRPTEKSLFDYLDKKDPQLSKIIKDSMFVFEDIVKLDERAIQTVVNKVTDNEVIAKALRTASEELKARFYKAMSKSRLEIIQDQDERLGRIRLSDAEEAQQKISNIVKELEKTGEIIIQRGEEDVIL